MSAGPVALARILTERASVVREAFRSRVEEVVAARAAPRRVVIVGMPRPPAVEEALTLETEAGVSRFILVQAERPPPGRVLPERVERVLAAAVTRCGRPDVPAVFGPMRLGGGGPV